ncbi:MAG TPA: 6,7-dimethyl-8-ribityllumazine synthase [Candidatus Methylomirabilis sp.]|nr:6,7-dimethyl-8-ribityllumazine synthase [Candidatus Methylomirabilis sp.]
MSGRASAAVIGPVVARQRFAVLAARFNEAISEKLLDGALAAFATHGVPRSAVDVHWVPGSFELPQAGMALARTGRYAGIVCVGAVIKGETPHWDYVASAAAQGIARAALDSGVPMSFGVITALTTEQAWARAGGAVGNRGQEAALAALEMAAWLHALGEARRDRSEGKETRGHRGERRDRRSRARAR